MATLSPMHTIAPSIRLIMAMFRLYADINSSFGRSIVDLLKKSYPGEKIDIEPQGLGSKLMNIVKKQVQYDETRAEDVIQDFLTYLISKNWDFKKDFPDWHDAVNAIYTNLRRRAISESMGKSRKKKREKGVDEAYGTRPEGGGTPEGGEAKMPTDPETALGKALDDKAAVKEFIDVIDEHIDDLKKSLTPDSRALFDLIFEDNVGSFGSDIKENMGQASALKEKFPDLYAKNAKRWSGFVGDLRKKLLEEIWKYIDNNMEPAAYDVLKETFFGDADPSAIRQGEKKKVQDKLDYQRGIDERKIARFKWKEQSGALTPSEKSSFESLKKKLKKEGVDVEAIKANENPGKDEAEPQVASLNPDIVAAQMKLERALYVAARIASGKTKFSWMS
jgi:hypothetical protein